ncbi:MAG: protein kinase domain-containing protein [Phycisphaerales bacterium]
MPVQIAGYRIVRLIGAGGMGLVYEAEQEALHRRVALKVMQPGAVSAESLARFESEARALARLKHPGIAQVFDTGVYRPGGAGGDDTSIVPFLSMELVEESITLHDYCERSDVTLDDKIRVIVHVCDALEHAHCEGVVHRDLKPSNILVNPAIAADGSEKSPIKIIDFGIAKVIGDSARTITSRGQILGTPAYMAPEQLIGGAVDDRSDIYSLGVILYRLCTGRFPIDMHAGLDRRSMEGMVYDATPALPRTLNRNLAGDIETIVLKCLQKGSLERYQSVRELREDLLAFRAGEPIRARRVGVFASARRALGRVVARHSFAAFLACAGVALLFAMLVVQPGIIFWSSIGVRYSSAVSGFAPASGMLPSLPDVRVLTIDDQTDVEALAAQQGIAGVTKNNIRSIRLIHAETLKRLAQADPSAVAIDVMFRKPSEFDAPLIGAISDLRARGIGVVIANPFWSFGADGLPAIAPDFARVAWTGPPTGGFTSPDRWGMDLALERAATEVVAGFSLLTFAACRAPDAEVAVALQNGIAEIRYFKTGTQRRATLRGPDRLRYSGVQNVTEPDPDRGLLPGDLLAISVVPLPMDGLTNCTMSLQRFFALTDSERRREFMGKVVLIGNATETGGDIQISSSGLKVPGVWTHATTVQQMLRDEIVDSPNMSVLWWTAGFMAVAGVSAGVGFTRSWGAAVLMTVLTLIAICVSVLLLRAGAVYWNPLSAIAAGWLGCGLAMFMTHDVRRARVSRIGSV